MLRPGEVHTLPYSQSGRIPRYVPYNGHFACSSCKRTASGSLIGVPADIACITHRRAEASEKERDDLRMALAEAEAEIARLRSQAAVSPPIQTEPAVGDYIPPPHSRPRLPAATPGEDEEVAEAVEAVEGEPPATGSAGIRKRKARDQEGKRKHVIKKESERTALEMKLRKACS